MVLTVSPKSRFVRSTGLLLGVALMAAGLLAAPSLAQDTGVSTPAAEQPGTPAVEEVQPAPAAPDATLQAAPEPAQDTGPSLQTDPVPADLPHDLSPWGMFMAADWVVKGVMIGLAFASLVTWTVWLAKSLELMGARTRLRGALRALVGAASLDDAAAALDRRHGPGARLVKAAREEVALSERALAHVSGDGLKERVESRLSRVQAQTSRRLTRGTGVLATIGSTAPFVGLFGTVWGIMNAFIGISEAQTTNLAVVAPGIAEALLATALGLVAAIPAVVMYNSFARSITGYRQALADGAAIVAQLVSRDIDYRTVPGSPQGRAALSSDRTVPQAAAE